MGEKRKSDLMGMEPENQLPESAVVEVMPASVERGLTIFSAERLRPVSQPGVSAVAYRLGELVLVGKPEQQQFVRAYENPDFAHDFAMLYDTVNSEFFMVAPELIDEVGPDVRMRTLYTLVDWRGRVWLWPLLAQGGDRVDSYTRSGHEAVMRAYSTWVRLIAVGGKGPIRAIPSADNLPEPVWPQDYYALIEQGFAGRVITSVKHPLVRRMRGQIKP